MEMRSICRASKGILLCDDDGLFPEHFTSSWEDKVLLTELNREETLAWYRNPGRASQDSLGIVYEDGGDERILRPDFIFFVKRDDGSIAADIVDPHGHHLADSLPKLKGLADYAEENQGVFRRIEAVAKTEAGYRVLDLTEATVRSEIHSAKSAKAVFDSSHGSNYAV